MTNLRIKRVMRRDGIQGHFRKSKQNPWCAFGRVEVLKMNMEEV